MSMVSSGRPGPDDFNRLNIEGAGYWDLATWNGRRSSASLGYIKPNRNRKNLRVLTEAYVTKVAFEGKAATGVAYERDGEVHHARADREVILSAGALQTPQLLQVSGIGPADLLKEHGIDVVHESKGVGENLIDHVQVGRKYTTTSEYTLNKKVGSIFSQVKAGINYYLGSRDGPLTIGASLAGAYVFTRPEVETPDLHLHFLPFMPGEKGWDLAVVAPRLRVRGVDRLRVIDASVMPTIASGNINAAVLMIGEKGADLVKAAQ